MLFLPVTDGLVLAICPFTGSLRDFSGAGNHPTVASMYWAQTGAVDGVVGRPAATNMTVATNAGLQTVDFALFYRSARGLAGGYTQLVFERGGTADLEHRLHASGDFVQLYAGGVLSQVAHSFIGANSIGISSSSGSKPDFYVDGVFVGQGHVAAASVGSANPIRVGRSPLPLNADLTMLAYYNEAKTATEFAKLHAYSQSRITPRKQWPGSGMRYPGRETNLAAPTEAANWTPIGSAIITDIPDGIRVEYGGAAWPLARMAALTIGEQVRVQLELRIGGAATSARIYTGASFTAFAYAVFTAVDFLAIADGTAFDLRAITVAAGFAEFRNIKAWTNPPGYTPATGDPMWVDNLQSARVTLQNQTSGFMSNTPAHIESGTFALGEDATGRYYDCIGAGKLRVRLLGANTYTTALFTEEGGATITKDATGFDLDFGAGDKVRAVQLTAP